MGRRPVGGLVPGGSPGPGLSRRSPGCPLRAHGVSRAASSGAAVALRLRPRHRPRSPVPTASPWAALFLVPPRRTSCGLSRFSCPCHGNGVFLVLI